MLFVEVLEGLCRKYNVENKAFIQSKSGFAVVQLSDLWLSATFSWLATRDTT